MSGQGGKTIITAALTSGIHIPTTSAHLDSARVIIARAPYTSAGSEDGRYPP